jgi:hypothetical protein
MTKVVLLRYCVLLEDVNLVVRYITHKLGVPFEEMLV